MLHCIEEIETLSSIDGVGHIVLYFRNLIISDIVILFQVTLSRAGHLSAICIFDDPEFWMVLLQALCRLIALTSGIPVDSTFIIIAERVTAKK